MEAEQGQVINIKVAKAAYKKRLAEAVKWLQGEGRDEKPVTAARIYRVDANSVGKALNRALKRAGKKVQHRGQNKLLSETQSKAIEVYYYK